MSSTSSDSDEYSFRVIRETNRENDKNFMSSKKNFIKDFQNSSLIFVNETPKRKKKHLGEFENYLNSSQTNKKKKVRHSNEGDVVDNEHHDFVTVRVNHKKNRMLADADELEVSSRKLKSEGSKNKHKKNKIQSLPGELNLLEVESVGNEQEQAVSRKKQKKRQNCSNIESKSSVNRLLQLRKGNLTRTDSIISTSTKVDKTWPPQDLNESIQSLLDFEQKNLPIQNIEHEAAILHWQLPKKKSKKATKTVDDPAHILKTFEKNNLSLKKVDFGSDSLHNIKENRSCFILKVPVDLDPNQLIGKDISLHKKKRIQVGATKYVTTPRESEANLIVLGENQHLRLQMSHMVTMKTKEENLSIRENKILDDLIAEQVTSVSSFNEKQENLEKFPTKNPKNNVNLFDRFLKDGAKFLEAMKLVSFKLKNEILMVDLEKQTNLVLQKQIEFLQEQNTSTAKYKKSKKKLEKQTRELLHKRVNIMKTNKGRSNENCNI